MVSSAHEAPRAVTILGATGSIGRSAVAVIKANGARYRVESVAGGRDVAKLAAVARDLGAKCAAIADPAGYKDLKSALSGSGIEPMAGEAAVCEAAARPADRVVAAITGIAGLASTCAALAQGATVALANKESLVSAGAYVLKLARESGARLLPLDSEHNALFQALGGQPVSTVEKMVITASGGPFRTWTKEAIIDAPLEKALAHPNWSMGSKITIDSASMMNKGLELIEAHHIFGLPEERLGVLVHPQQIIHGLVEFTDGSWTAGMAVTDMCVPMAHCLAWPDRAESGARKLDLAAIGKLEFEPEDRDRFPALRLARQAMRQGGAMPTILNAANEVAVAAYLNRQIRFGDIVDIVESVMEMPRLSDFGIPASLADAISVDHESRTYAREELSRRQLRGTF